MEALAPALFAVALAELGDRPPVLGAMLADRYPSILAVLGGLIVAHAAGFAIAAVGGAWVAPILNDRAASLMLALALASAALPSWRPLRIADRLEHWRIGAFPTSLLGLFILSAGGRSQFLAFAFAARASDPAYAAIGSTLGAIVIGFVAMALGEAQWRSLPPWPIRIVTVLIFGGAAILAALSAFALI